MQNWTVLLPPFLVLIFAIATHNVLRSLWIGIITAALIATKFSLFKAIKLAFSKVLVQTDIPNILTWSGNFNNLYIYGFLLILGIIIALITYTGGTLAYSKKISGKLSGPKAAEGISLVLSTCFFLDDYFNSLTTGSIVRPIFDHFRIARAKLAFLIDAMSSSMAVLVPLSSWTAMIISQLLESGVNETLTNSTLILGDPFLIYLRSIPYTFYPLCTILSTWFIVRYGLSYGSMAKHEEIAATTGNLFGGKNPPIQKLKEPEHLRGTFSDFLIPMVTLIVLIFTGLLYTGGFTLLGGTKNFINALRSSDSFTAFFYAGLITLISCSCYFLLKKKIEPRALVQIYLNGFELMKNSLLLILFAATLGSLLKDNLQTGQYLAHLLVGKVPTFLLPLIFFLTSITVTLSTGSSWGTILIMFPIALPMIASVSSTTVLSSENIQLLLPAIGAILSGSVAGAHISPISDATVISSTASGAHHIDHITTQFYYVIPAIIGTSLSYIASGLLAGKNTIIALGVPFLIALATTLTIIFMSNQLYKKIRPGIKV